MANFRKKIISFYQSSLPEPYAGLLAGITLGSKGALTSILGKVKYVGVAHVVVASGTNVTFVVMFLISTLTLVLPRKSDTICYIRHYFVSIYFGFDAPLIRSAVMAGSLLGVESGRLINTWRNLVVTALLMLIYNGLVN